MWHEMATGRAAPGREGIGEEMTTAFADTSYFLALLDSREERHQQAVATSSNPQLRLLKQRTSIFRDDGELSNHFNLLFQPDVRRGSANHHVESARLDDEAVGLFTPECQLLRRQ